MNEQEFAFRIRQALNEGADSVSYKASLRLEKARQLAVARARGGAALARPATVRLPALQLATVGHAPIDAPGSSGGLWGWLRGAGLVAPLLALAVGFVAIYEWHSRQFIAELADVDFAVLLDEAPIGAYADAGFGAMLTRRAPSVAGHDMASELATDVVEAGATEANETTEATDASETPTAADPAAAAEATASTPSGDRAAVAPVPAQR
jgi:hypothetical protein